MIRRLPKPQFPFLAAITLIAAYATGAKAQPCELFGCPGLVDVSVTTHRPSYIVGDPIVYSIIATNPAPEPVTLRFSTSRQADYTIDGVYSPDDVALQVLTGRTVPAHGSVSWEFFHPWDQYSLSAGGHSVVGEVVGYGRSEPASFTVSPPAPVTDDVFIDFEQFPDGTPTHDGRQITHRLWNDAFVRKGVRFRSEGDRGSVNISVRTFDNAVLHTPTTSYPPGFNIVAEFDMPVYTVAADVQSAPNYAVTMYAYDANRALLGSVTSESVAGEPFVPLSFDSHVAIASVHWFPSIQNYSVVIDNLFLNVDPTDIAGDFNADGSVDAADYVYWRKRSGPTADRSVGADNNDVTMDAGDIDLWRQNFGRQRSSPFAATSIPEPAAALIAIVALAALLTYRSIPQRPIMPLGHDRRVALSR